MSQSTSSGPWTPASPAEADREAWEAAADRMMDDLFAEVDAEVRRPRAVAGKTVILPVAAATTPAAEPELGLARPMPPVPPPTPAGPQPAPAVLRWLTPARSLVLGSSLLGLSLGLGLVAWQRQQQAQQQWLADQRFASEIQQGLGRLEALSAETRSTAPAVAPVPPALPGLPSPETTPPPLTIAPPLSSTPLPPPPTELPAPTAAAPVAAGTPASPAPVASPRRLVGILALGNQSTALVEVDGSTLRLQRGEAIAATGQTISRIDGQTVTLSGPGGSRTLSVGQDF